MEIIFIVGRILFAAIFINSGIKHVTQAKNLGAYAKSMGIPAPEFMTVLSGIMIFVGAVSIIFDFYMFYGSLLIVLFLIPTAFTMHPFWKFEEPMTKATQEAQFMKNVALAGAALMLMYFSYGTL